MFFEGDKPAWSEYAVLEGDYVVAKGECGVAVCASWWCHAACGRVALFEGSTEFPRHRNTVRPSIEHRYYCVVDNLVMCGDWVGRNVRSASVTPLE